MDKKFTDTDGEVVSFYGTSSNEKVVTEDFTMSTTEVISINQHSQTTEYQHTGIQTDEQSINTEAQYNEDALLDFMRRVAPQVEVELRKSNKYFGVNFERSLLDEDEIIMKKIGVLLKHEKIGEMKCRHTAWSCYGNKIAVSFSHRKHVTWCKHSSFILIYECDKNEEYTNEAKETIENNTCIVDLKFHPVINTVLVFATEEGKIYWHNTNDDLESNSKNYIQHKSIKITQLSWVELNASLYLVVADSEGFLSFWATSFYIKDWQLWKKFTFRSSDINDRAIVCFDFSINSQHFVVALEGSMLLQCSSILTSAAVLGDQTYNPVVSNFECSSIVINNIAFSKFEENIFVVSTSDQFFKVYNLYEKISIFSIATDYVPLGLEWSYLQDNIFRAWSHDGEIIYYDYRNCSVINSFKLEEKIQSLAFKVKGMKLLYVAVDTNNNATIWQTGLFVK